MKLESFDQWFAIRPNHKDSEFWPARMIFDLDKGIWVETVNFSDQSKRLNFETDTMTGWLDYQCPTTVVRPRIQTVAGSTISVDTPATRDSYRLVAEAVLKNVFIEDLSEKVFIGIAVSHPAIHAWINPCLVQRSKLASQQDAIKTSIVLSEPKERKFELQDGTEAVVTSTAAVSGGAIHEDTLLELRFPAPVDYDTVTRIIWRTTTIFSFMIGHRLRAPIYELPTIRKRRWNDNEQEIIAELWYRPARQGSDAQPAEHSCLTTEGSTSISLNALLNHSVGGIDEMIYLADIIQTCDDKGIPLVQAYGELVGCLEDFDTRYFGSGADPALASAIQQIYRLVKQHGNSDDLSMFQRLRQSHRNSYSLLKRLERLHEHWHSDGFRGDPDLRRVRDIRNLVPHGRGLHLGRDTVEAMIAFRSYLIALGRYHVLRALGCTGAEVGSAFMRQPHRYGRFVPKETIGAASALI
jgi:hypothetical protein